MNIFPVQQNIVLSGLNELSPSARRTTKRVLSAHLFDNIAQGFAGLVAEVPSNGRVPVIHLSLGGVAERLIAPVLKTGRPKGLVSSNLTPSAY